MVNPYKPIVDDTTGPAVPGREPRRPMWAILLLGALSAVYVFVAAVATYEWVRATTERSAGNARAVAMRQWSYATTGVFALAFAVLAIVAILAIRRKTRHARTLAVLSAGGVVLAVLGSLL